MVTVAAAAGNAAARERSSSLIIPPRSLDQEHPGVITGFPVQYLHSCQTMQGSANPTPGRIADRPPGQPVLREIRSCRIGACLIAHGTARNRPFRTSGSIVKPHRPKPLPVGNASTFAESTIDSFHCGEKGLHRSQDRSNYEPIHQISFSTSSARSPALRHCTFLPHYELAQSH